jgi:hypothetical protein
MVGPTEFFFKNKNCSKQFLYKIKTAKVYLMSGNGTGNGEMLEKIQEIAKFFGLKVSY